MVKIPLPETTFTVVSLEDQWISPEGLLGEGSPTLADRVWKRDLIKISALSFTLSETLSRYQAFIKPSQPLSELTQQLTGVTASDFECALSLKEALQGLVDFCQGSVLICHNASYVIGEFNEKLKACGLSRLTGPCLDTQQLIRQHHPEWNTMSSRIMAKHYQLDVANLDYSERIQAIFKAVSRELESSQELLAVTDLMVSVAEAE